MVQIKIERIGDDSYQAMKFHCNLAISLVPGLGDITFGKPTSNAWCAEIVGPHPRFKFCRIEGEQLIRMEKWEVEAWLKNRSE